MPTSPLLSPANVSRWAAAPTILMGLANIPSGFEPEPFDLPPALAWFFTAVGVAGLLAAGALLRRHPAAPAAVLAIGFINIVGGLAVLARGYGSGVAGLVLGALSIALLVVPWLRTRGRTGAAARA
jgi:hypothetical protein